MSSYYINPPVAKRKVRSNVNGKTRIPTVASRVTKGKENMPPKVQNTSVIKTTVKQVNEKPKATKTEKGKRLPLNILTNPKSVLPSNSSKSMKETSKLCQLDMQVAIFVPSSSNESKDTIGFTVEGNSIQMNGNVLSQHQDLFVELFDSVILEDTPTEAKGDISVLFRTEDKHQVTTAFVCTEGQSFFVAKPKILKAIIEDWLPLNNENGQVQFSYCFAFDNQIFDLLDANTKVELQDREFNYSQRKIFAVEHTLDLIQLGNLNNAINQLDWAGKNRFYVYHFCFVNETKSNQQDGDSKHFFLVEANINSQNSAQDDLSDIFKAIDICVRTRQRKQSPIPVENDALTHFLKCCFTNEKSKLTFFYVLSKERFISNQTPHMLDFIRRLKVYGTADDNYGDSIIQKNQALIANLKKSDEMGIYLYLLNNVSILEKDLLESHKHFNEITNNWSEHHRCLQKMSSESQMYDVDKYTSQLLKLLNEQWSQIGTLIDSVNKFRTGLVQLQQSVNENEIDDAPTI